MKLKSSMNVHVCWLFVGKFVTDEAVCLLKTIFKVCPLIAMHVTVASVTLVL